MRKVLFSKAHSGSLPMQAVHASLSALTLNDHQSCRRLQEGACACALFLGGGLNRGCAQIRDSR